MTVILETYDTMWMNHLDEIDYLRGGIGLRGYGQRDPLIEYKREAFSMFTHLMENIKSSIAYTIFRISSAPQQTVPAVSGPVNLTFSGGGEVEQFGAAKQRLENKEQRTGTNSKAKKSEPIINKGKIGRNDPCPCGSGKK